MAMQKLNGAPKRIDHLASMSDADRAAHEAASYVRSPSPAAADHEKVRDPQLPQRPRGPHPQYVKAVTS